MEHPFFPYELLGLVDSDIEGVTVLLEPGATSIDRSRRQTYRNLSKERIQGVEEARENGLQ